MKIIDNYLFIEFSEMIEAGFNPSTITSAKYRNAASWFIIKNPRDKRKLLIGYEYLPKKYKEKIIKKYGNPYTYYSKNKRPWN